MDRKEAQDLDRHIERPDDETEGPDDQPRISEVDMEDHIRIAFAESGDLFPRIETFGEAGVLTRNRGVVVRTNDGQEFQITIVRSR